MGIATYMKFWEEIRLALQHGYKPVI